jgi:hypothetical protein
MTVVYQCAKGINLYDGGQLPGLSATKNIVFVCFPDKLVKDAKHTRLEERAS